MCVLIALRQAAGPLLLVGANRDERVDRPWLPPSRLVDDPPILGGRDLLAGGSWLAVNLAAPMVIGVSNARLGAPPGERSRGELVMTLAREAGVAEAAALVAELDLERYGPFNLLIADAHKAWSATNEPVRRLRREEEAAVVIANDPLVAAGERVARAVRHAASLAGETPERARTALEGMLADHGGPDPLCRHGKGYGTLCSTFVELAPHGCVRYRFAAGPPCVTPFADVALPRTSS
jgi:uncharacterized protein with NRDE domain